MKIIISLAILLVSATVYSADSQIQFLNGWIKQLPPIVPMRAGYLQINNPSAKTIEIIALQSKAFDSIELHESKMEDGMMKMIQMDTLPLPSKSQVELKPGGKHFMLISPTQPLQIGDKVELTATFSNQTTQSFMLEVKK